MSPPSLGGQGRDGVAVAGSGVLPGPSLAETVSLRFGLGWGKGVWGWVFACCAFLRV